MSEQIADVAPRPRLLFLAHLLPWPLDGGGQIKSYHTLRILSSVYDVTLLAYIRPADRANFAEAQAVLEPLCAGGIKTVPLPRGRGHDLRAALGTLWSGGSFIVGRDDVREMRAAVGAELAKSTAPLTAIHVDHLQMMASIPEDAGSAKVILDNHNVEHRIPQRLSETAGNPLMRIFAEREWPRLRDFERDVCLRADLTLAVSPEDRDALIALDPPALDGKVKTVPIGVDLEYWGAVERDPASRSVLSIGTMYWPPNVDAVRYFCADILPRIREKRAATRFVIVGARPTAAIRVLGETDPLITVTGSVPDVRPWAAREGGVFVVPLRSGSGMRVKILNAMAMSLPVVSTKVGAEGIDVTDGEDILLADSPADFARAVLCLLDDPDRAARIGQAGRRLMERAYGWDAVGLRLLSIYAERVGKKPIA